MKQNEIVIYFFGPSLEPIEVNEGFATVYGEWGDTSQDLIFDATVTTILGEKKSLLNKFSTFFYYSIDSFK